MLGESHAYAADAGSGMVLFSPSATERIIKLNIGGYKYVTTRDTLTKHGENFFTAMLSGKFSVLKDEKGYYFIDRDGEYFAPILEYLRTGDFCIPPGQKEEAISREAMFYAIRLPISAHMKMKRATDYGLVRIQHDGFYLPTAIYEQRGVISNANVLCFRADGSGFFSDAKEFTYEIKDDVKDMVIVTLTCNNLPYNFLFRNGLLSDGSSEFSFFKPEEVITGVYYCGQIPIPETDITAILFGENHVFLRFSKRVMVRLGTEKSSLNAGLFQLTKTESFLGSQTTCLGISICKAASSGVQECQIQILSFGQVILVRDTKSSSGLFYAFHIMPKPTRF